MGYLTIHIAKKPEIYFVQEKYKNFKLRS